MIFPIVEERPLESSLRTESVSDNNRPIEKHRRKTIDAIKDFLKENDRVAVVRPTGYGKSLIAAELCYHFEGDKLILVPQNTIKDYIERYFQGNGNKLFIESYQKFTFTDTVEDIKSYFGDAHIQYIFLDEAHRAGAERWSEGVELILQAYPDAKVIGLTATSLRSDGVDIVDKFFEGKQIEPLTLVDSIAQGMLPAPTYVGALYTLDEVVRQKMGRIKKSRILKKEEKIKLLKELKDAVLDVSKVRNIPYILQKYLLQRPDFNSNMKFIVFCQDIETLFDAIDPVKGWFSDAFPDRVISAYQAHDRLSDTILRWQINLFEQKKSSEHIDLIFVVNMFNEGLHLDGVIGSIMLRKTESPVLYMQQIGRVISSQMDHNPIIFDLVNNYRLVKRGYVNTIKEALDEEKKKSSSDKDKTREDNLKRAVANIFDEAKEIMDALDGVLAFVRDGEPWTERETEILRKYYPIGSVKLVQSRGVLRSGAAIRNRAAKLGLVKEGRLPWTDKELAILREVYPTGGVEAVIRAGVNRTPRGISTKALEMGYREVKLWTPEEEDILREFYPKGGVKAVIEAGVKRSDRQIYWKASTLGLKNHSYNLRWSEEEDNIIRELYPDGGAEAVIRAGVKRGYKSILKRAYQLKVKLKKPVKRKDNI